MTANKISDESLLREVIEAMPDGVLLVDAGGRIVHANARIESLFGFTNAELRDKPVECLVPDRLGRPHAEYRASFAAQAHARPMGSGLELVGRRKDGREIPLDISLSPIAVSSDLNYIAVIRDLTKRKLVETRLRELNTYLEQGVAERTVRLDQMQAELLQSEERLRAIFDQAPVGISVVSPEGKNLRINEAYRRITGYGSDDARDVPFIYRIHPDDLVVAQRYFSELLAGQRDEYRLERRYIRADGSYVWVDASVTLVRDQQREPLFAVIILQDISLNKEAEQQREALAKSVKLRALGQMASGIAHDLNQSLGLILGHGELAQNEIRRLGGGIPTVSESLDIITRAAEDGASTIRRLQSFARGGQSRPKEHADLAAILRDVARLTAPRWHSGSQREGRPIDLAVSAGQNLYVEGWPDSLREALINLIFNAVDALPDGGTIRLSGKRDQSNVVIEIEDSGVGMSLETQNRIFEPFFTTKGDRGTGLGLAMVYHAVELHGGKISVRSSENAGTNFTIVLPAAAEPYKGNDRVQERQTGKALNILAVDDDALVARMLESMLKHVGHFVSMASSGEAGLAMILSEPFDLVFTDLGLGHGMNGWEFADRVHELDPTLPIVLATGWGADIDPHTAREHGILAVVSKPYRLKDLQSVLDLARRTQIGHSIQPPGGNGSWIIRESGI